MGTVDVISDSLVLQSEVMDWDNMCERGGGKRGVKRSNDDCMGVWTNWGLTVNKAMETHVTDRKVGTKGGMGGTGVRNLSKKKSKSITKKKNNIPRKNNQKKLLFKQGNILNYLEDPASVGGRGTLFKNETKNMAVAHFKPTLETSTTGTEAGGGMQLDGAWAGVGLWKKTGYVECTCTVTDTNKAT